MRYLRLFREFFRACLVEEFEYRANFLANVLMTIFTLLMSILTVSLFFYRTNSIGGWSYFEVLALLGVFTVIHGFIDFFLQPNMSRLVSHIRKGTLDFVLLKPVDSQFHVSFRHLVFWKLADVLFGFILIGYAVAQTGYIPAIEDILLFILFLASALCVVYSMWMGMMIFSFWAVKVDNLSFLFTSFFETARFPVSVYRGVLKLVLTYLFPIAFITTIPTAAIVGRLHWQDAWLAVGIAILFLLLSRVMWRFALRHYTSASS